MDEKRAIRAAAIRRARKERPRAHQAVREMYDTERWNNYWSREYPPAEPTYATAADLERASRGR